MKTYELWNATEVFPMQLQNFYWERSMIVFFTNSCGCLRNFFKLVVEVLKFNVEIASLSYTDMKIDFFLNLQPTPSTLVNFETLERHRFTGRKVKVEVPDFHF